MTNKSVIQCFALTLILTVCGCAPVSIHSAPPGAAVYKADSDKQVGTTPYNTSVFVSDKNYTVRKERFFEEPVKLDFESPRHINVNLRPMPVLVYSKPDAQVYAAGSATAIGKTPMKLPAYATNCTYILKSEGYYDQEVTVGPESQDTLVVELNRRPLVTIASAPSGVDVYENGKRVGATPLQQEVQGLRVFELRKEGYFTRGIVLTGAPPYEVSAELKPFPVITVTATPANAKVYQAGSKTGAAVPFKLAVGKQIVLEVRADRYYPQSVTLQPKATETINVALKAMPYVTINSQPAGAELFINGKSIGAAPVEQLIEKDTVVELRKEGFVTKTATLTGADKQVTVTLEAVPPPAAPEETNAVTQAAADTQAPAAQAPVTTAPAVEEEKKATGLPWIAIGGAVAAIAGIILFLIKRKKK